MAKRYILRNPTLKYNFSIGTRAPEVWFQSVIDRVKKAEAENKTPNPLHLAVSQTKLADWTVTVTDY